MTFNIGHVQDGTNAGWKVEKQARTEPWACKCRADNKPTWRNCPDCYEPRPKE